MRRAALFAAFLFFTPLIAPAVPLDDDAEIDGQYLKVTIPPAGGSVSGLALKAAPGNIAGEDGLLEEGFGVPNPYVPGRRLNEKMEVLDSVKDRPVLVYSYDCEGPNITGLHVEKKIEPLPDRASVRVTWRVENRGVERHWVAPWVRFPVRPGGSFGAEDRVDVPTSDGIRQIKESSFFAAVRNWAAVTDTTALLTVYGVFNADAAHSFLAVYEPEDKRCGFQTAFVPRVMEPKDTWETVYYLNVVRGLRHVNFATDELAAQVDYQAGKLDVLLAATQSLQGLQIHASVRAANGRVWKLPPKAFSIDPNRVVRCSYEWQAPADGVYDFMAQLTRGEKDVVNLGKDTAPPHGGIDTQFTVGTAKGAVLEPWTDATLALERGKRTLKRALAAESPVPVWFESGLEKVFQNDEVAANGPLDPTARVRLARNEYESFQIVVSPPKDTDVCDVTVAFDDLVNGASGKKIPAGNIRAYNVSYCPVRVPTHFEGVTGRFPDALPPQKPITAKGGQSTPIWVTVYAPPGTPAGAYTGKMTLSSAGNSPIVLQVEATVYDFDVPVTPSLKTDFGFWPDKARSGCKAQGSTLAPQEVDARYVNNALEHRVTLRESAQLPGPSASYAADLAKCESRLKSLLLRGATSFSVPASLLENPEQLKAADALVVKLGLQKKAFCQMADEPPSPVWPRLVEKMKLWTEIAPNTPLMLTAMGVEPFLPEGVGLWCVHTQLLDTLNNKPILERVQSGKDVWCYVNNYPPRPYANFFVDFSGVEHRILFWQTWALGMRGVHYWGVNYSVDRQNPYDGLCDVTPVNGDGFLVYPGAQGPVNSIRWEIIRDGIEDYDYLVMLMERFRAVQKKGGNEALLERVAQAMDLKPIVPDLVSFPRDPAVLLQKRDAIAQAIVELGKATK